MRGRRCFWVILLLTVVLSVSAGCGSRTDEIFVLSREDGSGTRSAFIQLMGVEHTDADGNRTDRTIETAEITNSTGVMLSSVAENENAIGYVSMGALNGNVKALAIDGAAATAENVRNGSYPVSRALSVVVPPVLSPAAQDLLAFVLSARGQMIVEEAGYVSCGVSGEIPAAAVSGQVTVSGSSSVFPVMEKLAEAYMAVRPEVTVVLQTSDSTTGIRDTADGLCDLGMTSRQLTTDEERRVEAVPVALDGIAVIVHRNNPLEGLNCRQVCDIYTGCVTSWKQLLG